MMTAQEMTAMIMTFKYTIENTMGTIGKEIKGKLDEKLTTLDRGMENLDRGMEDLRSEIRMNGRKQD